jgi:hypothetical protein
MALNGRSSGEQSRSVESVQESDHRQPHLLRARRQRPRDRGAEAGDQFAPSDSARHVTLRLPRPLHWALMPATLMIGHHFSISAFW